MNSNKKKQIFVDIQNARLPHQKKVMRKIINEGYDPFSLKHIHAGTYHKAEILKEGKYWILTKNQWPYKKVKTQLMAIYKKYTENPWNLPAPAYRELFKLFAWGAKEYEIKGGAMCMRFGNTQHSGATVKRLHAQLIEPDLNNPNYKPVLFYIGGQKSSKNEANHRI